MYFRNWSYRIIIAAIALVSGLHLSSCELWEPKTAVLWTDRPEFAVYAEYFNTSQTRYKLEVFYQEAPAEALSGAATVPDLVIGSWLKGASTRTLFKPLDYFFDDLLLSSAAFYPALLSLGNIESRQYLLPVAFNIPALVFSKENAALVGTPFILTLEETQRLGKDYNSSKDGIYSRMGFSPRWSDDFLFITTTLFGASYREGSPLAWNPEALEQALTYIRRWTTDANGSVQAEDDFAFKYLYEPSPLPATSGRILFAYLNSADLFTVTQERRATLDFRWVAKETTIPVVEGAAYLGICKAGKAKNAADAFVQWFYKEDNQLKLLEMSKKYRLNETLFGIGNGFSALYGVNEQIYPRFYPSLLGHVPPRDYLAPPNILPTNWLTLKERVILPYLHQRSQTGGGASLEARLEEWERLNSNR